MQIGPYRIMRHPSYAGVILAYLAFACMLDALWVLIPAKVLIDPANCPGG